MSTVNPSDGDGVRLVNYEDNRVNPTQGDQGTVADDAQVRGLPEGQPERLSLLQFTADYRRFGLDDVLARREPTAAYSANAQTGLSGADLEARARRIFDRFQNDRFLNSSTPYADIAAELAGLSPQDALRLREIYQQRYSAQRGGRDLLADVALEINELQDRLRAFRILAPDRVHAQDVPLAQRGNQAGIVADPPFAELVSGSTVKYTFDEGAVIRAPNSYPFVRYLVQGPDGVETRAGHTFDGQYEKPGVYRVTFEVINRGQPPRYYTLRQVVRDPAEKAREVLLNLPGTTIDPELFLLGIDAQIGEVERQLNPLRARLNELRSRDFFSQPQWEINQLDSQVRNLEDALSQLKEIRQEAPGKLFGGATGPVIPLQAALVPTERPQPVPLQLYAKPLGGNRWAIVDMTSPANARVFEGQAGATSEDGLRSAWREFVSANNLPAGQVAALPPAGMNFGQEVWNDQSAGRSGFQQWASNLGWGSLALAALGVAAVFVPGLQGFAPPLFIAAGVTGAASGGLNIYDRVQYGNFQWNSAETALDMLSIVGGLAGGGGGTAALLRGGAVTLRTAEGASVTLRNLGKFTSITHGVDAGAGVASGVIIANVWLQQIERINNSNLPAAEKQRQVNAVLQQAAMMGGIVVVGRGISRFTPLLANELDDLLRAARFEPELDQLVRNTPGLQRALQEQGADTLRTLYADYKAGGVNRTGLNVSSFLEYVSSRGVPTRTERVPRSLEEALGISTEGLRHMSARELNEAVLTSANPNLLATFRRGDLPPGASAALADVLSQDLRLATMNFERARGALSEVLNERLGTSVGTVAELRQVLRFIGEPANRGSIGEYFYQSRLAAGNQPRKPTIPRSEFERVAPGANPNNAVFPDFLRPNSRRTLDIKTGYEDGGIEKPQIADYSRIIAASQRPNGALRRRLEGMGVPGGRLAGHDYLFISNGTTSARQSAERAYAQLERNLSDEEMKFFAVYYLDDDGLIYRYAGPNNSVRIGTQLPD
ncbi:MAG TPA: hypothetical protein VN282_07085 [Pyrinomonadaceae bacterium]|nr:hypothetical protein [Pyrinomonadaceae bacterium]